jgi:predicted DNA binding CopG/RHH family protein
MKQPKLSELKTEKKATQSLRTKILKTKKIKITINVDSDILSHLRKTAAKSGAPYQTLLNRLLREVIAKKASEETRLDYLEKEISVIKKSLAA